MELDCMPSKEELEWYLPNRGKDGKGRAVFYDENTGAFIPVSGFRDRVDAWKNSLPPGYDDPYRLEEMPCRTLIDALAHNQRGVAFDLKTHRIEVFPLT